MDDVEACTDVNKVIPKRSARKRSIKTAYAYWEKNKNERMEVIRTVDVEGKIQLVHEQSAIYSRIQEKIIELLEAEGKDEKVAGEEEEFESQLEHHVELIGRLTGLLDAKRCHITATAIVDDIKGLEDEDTLQGEGARATLTQLRERLTGLRKDMAAVVERYQEEPRVLMEGITVRLRALHTRQDKESAVDVTKVSPIVIDDPKVVVRQAGPRLPEIKFPKFNGNRLEWPMFWEEFNRILARYPDLQDPDKLTFLRMSVTTAEAERHFSTLASLPDGYKEMEKRLKDLYDDPRLIFEANIKELVQARPVEEAEATSWFNTLHKVRYAVEKSGQGTADYILSVLAEMKLTGTLRDKWIVDSEKQKKVPSSDMLLDFLERTGRNFAKQNDGKTRPRQKPPQQQQQQSQQKQPRSQVMYTQPEGTGKMCELCKTERHPLFQCPKYQTMNVTKKNEMARKMKVCLNCLRQGHFLRQCRDTSTCTVCGKRHHSSLHKTEEEMSNWRNETEPVVAAALSTTAGAEDNETRPQMRQSSAMLQTGVVTVEAGGMKLQARAFFDTGSTVTFIAADLVRRLRAKPYKVYQPTSGAGRQDGFTITRCVDIKIHTRDPSQDPPFSEQAAVTPHVSLDLPATSLKQVRALSMLQGLDLADPHFDSPGRIDLLLGAEVTGRMGKPGLKFSEDKQYQVRNSMFGWIVSGGSREGVQEVMVHHTVLSDTDPTHNLIKTFWEVEEGPGEESQLTRDEEVAVQHFKDNVKRGEDGRFIVKLPKKTPTPELGRSREQAVKRFITNECSLKKKGRWQEFEDVVSEYETLKHAELVPVDELGKDSYYLPMHGVAKRESTTTKLRVVFDASAKTTTGSSLNDMLLPGPNLYPLLADIMVKFRSHRVGMSADISKMFREVVLHPEERDHHRFIRRTETGQLKDWRMTRLTFGVTCSPFLATQVLRQLADEYENEYPTACDTIRRQFYVDDCLSGADSEEEAMRLREDLNTVHGKGGMLLRKWRSSSEAVNKTIPEELREKEKEQTISAPTQCHKALGIHWDTGEDTLHVSTPMLQEQRASTKRQVSSDLARTFDLLGWFAPAMITAKIMLQKVWTQGLGWDDEVPPGVKEQWRAWTDELHHLTRHPIPRYYFKKKKTLQSVQLHGFADASKAAYGAVVYARAFYSDATTSVSIVVARTKVAPIKELTIPRLELCGALLLSKILTEVGKLLSIPTNDMFAWSDSAIVLGWLRHNPGHLKTFVANRVSKIAGRVPPNQWKHVATELNPADAASRGMTPQELVVFKLWWEGPPWLKLSPAQWPARPDLVRKRELPELKLKMVTAVQLSPQYPELTERFSSWNKVVRVMAWVRRFVRNTKKISHSDRILVSHLDTDELEQAEIHLFKAEQLQHFPDEIDALRHNKEISLRSKLAARRPFLDEQGLLRVGGRLERSELSYDAQHPVILSAKSHVTRSMVRQIHEQHQHVGPSGLMGMMTERFHIIGARNLARDVTRGCVICRRCQAKNAKQLMGQLPPNRTNTGAAFSEVGTDYAGPILLKLGRVRKPVLVKGFICLFVCMTTKAVHLEAVTDLTTQAFLAALHRFVGRRGLPKVILSDNGKNYVGAEGELKSLYQLMQTADHIDRMQRYLSDHRIRWKRTPSKAPHFGGLWEANVKSTKTLLRKTVGSSHLTYEELSTTLVRIEAILNSRPLVPLNSPPTDGALVLTPGHFLIGRPLCALPSRLEMEPQRFLKRWNLCQHLARQFWLTWSKEYVVTLNRFQKWIRPERNVAVGDVVLVKDQELFMHSWPLARVTAIHPGQDTFVRAATVYMNGKEYRRPIHGLSILLSEDEQISPGRMDKHGLSKETES